MSGAKVALLLIAVLAVPMTIGLFITLNDMKGLSDANEAPAPPHVWSGPTMGMTWRVLFPGDAEAPDQAVQDGIIAELATVNREMSTYQDDSEISVFNRSESTDWMDVSPGFAETMTLSQSIASKSRGALDPTLGPVIRLWGFGRSGPRTTAPPEADIEALRTVVGQDKVLVRATPPAIRKSVPGVSLNLSAIAKGHGLDRVATVLDKADVRNYFIDIGGEIRTRGRKGDRSWRVAIERPNDSGRNIQLRVPLENASIATSGDYRQFFLDQGRRYSHTIDPRTLRPITHGVASVSVVAGTCAEADGWATALSVLGMPHALNLANDERLCALILERTEDGYRAHESNAWSQRFSR